MYARQLLLILAHGLQIEHCYDMLFCLMGFTTSSTSLYVISMYMYAPQIWRLGQIV